MAITLRLPNGGTLLVEPSPGPAPPSQAAGSSDAFGAAQMGGFGAGGAPQDGFQQTSALIDNAAERVNQAVGAIEKDLDEVIGTLCVVAETVRKKSKELANELAPDEITLKLGVKLSAKGDVMLASAAGEATLNVEFKWKNS